MAYEELYVKPAGGIPSTDMTVEVQTSLGKADTAYQKPSGGIPSTDLTSAVQTELQSISEKQAKPTYATKTLLSSGWVNKVYSGLNTDYPFASYDIEVSISPSATDSQRDAYASAMMTGSSTDNTIKALGDAPSVDIPVFVKVWSK